MWVVAFPLAGNPSNTTEIKVPVGHGERDLAESDVHYGSVSGFGVCGLWVFPAGEVHRKATGAARGEVRQARSSARLSGRGR